MKTIYILLISALLATQSFALSKNEKRFLLGLGTGAILGYALHANESPKVRYGKIIYRDSHSDRRKHHHYVKYHKKHHKHHGRRCYKKHHKHSHHHHYYGYGRHNYRY